MIVLRVKLFCLFFISILFFDVVQAAADHDFHWYGLMTSEWRTEKSSIDGKSVEFKPLGFSVFRFYQVYSLGFDLNYFSRKKDSSYYQIEQARYMFSLDLNYHPVPFWNWFPYIGVLCGSFYEVISSQTKDDQIKDVRSPHLFYGFSLGIWGHLGKKWIATTSFRFLDSKMFSTQPQVGYRIGFGALF